MSKLLSKSKYLLGLQCPKLLWVVFNEPEKIPEPDQATQHIFDQGHLVGELAKKWFPDGIDLASEDFKGNIEKTKELLAKRKPLFEAGFMVDNLYARADLLNPVEKDEWDIIEVKSSTSVKEVNFHDVSFQKHCYEKSGLKIRKCFLMHINNKYVKEGDIDHKQLFVMEDITEDVKSAIIGIQERIKAIMNVISSKECPDIKIGPHCSDPYGCALSDDCWDFLPDNSVFNLCRAGKKAWELFELDVLYIKDISDEYKLTTNQQIQKNCEKTGKPYIKKDKIKKFLDTLKHPLYFLDFETFNTAIPLYDGVRPYQQITFQFSLYVQDKPDGKLVHHSFLAEGKEDPRLMFLSSLQKVLGEKGSIIAYNQSFEIGRLKELAEAFTDYKKWIESILPRFIDLMVPFRKFYYYNPVQQGSASIKKVLPAITGKGYDDMEISEGGTASLEFLRITQGASDGTFPDNNEIKKVRENLEKYCALDTEGMVWIVNRLKELIKD